jgi:hypothetical protein
MVEIMTRDIAGSELKEVVNKLYVQIQYSFQSFNVLFSILVYQIVLARKSKNFVVEFIHYKM